jgi:ClpP class serine protease
MPNWNQVHQEIVRAQLQAAVAGDTIRRGYLDELFRHTSRNVIAYYSGWLSKPGIGQLEINDEDKNGFMLTVHELDRLKGLDLILHTPGGGISATQSIVNYLHKMFKGADSVLKCTPGGDHSRRSTSRGVR